MNFKIFVSENCEKCGPARKLGEDLRGLGYEVEIFDINTIDGLSEAAFSSIETTPEIIIEMEGVKCSTAI